jgi:ABC-type polysaccharide/polyol phosphate transport system ATPase subunit
MEVVLSPADATDMILRLGFAVATCFEPEILLMDEWILSDDTHFMGKAETRIQYFIERASIMVLVSHNLDLCRRWCNIGVWLDRETVRELGPVGQVIERYQAFVAGSEER